MKKFSLLLAIVMATFFLASCQSASDSAITPSAPDSYIPIEEENSIEITVITSYGGDDGNRQNYERAIRAYEAASGVIVKDDSSVSSEEWKAQVMDGFENGTEPDVLFYFTGVDSNKLVETGKVVPIDEIRERYPDYASNMEDNLLAKSPVDNKSYAVPVNGYWEGLFVNKKVLADCGVDIPGANTTWAQFLEDCRKIADKGYTPIAASLNEVPHYWFEFCVFNNGNAGTHTELPQSSSDARGKDWADGLYDIKDLYEKGFFPENTTTASYTETDALIISDQAAFMIDGSWKIGWFAENAADINNFTVTYVPGKGERKNTDVIGGLSMGYFITRSAWEDPEKQEACIEFIKAMTANEVVATFGATNVTALKDGIDPPSDANSLVKDALKMIKGASNFVGATQDGLPPNSRTDLFANVSNIVTGETTAEKAIDHCLAIKD